MRRDEERVTCDPRPYGVATHKKCHPRTLPGWPFLSQGNYSVVLGLILRPNLRINLPQVDTLREVFRQSVSIREIRGPTSSRPCASLPQTHPNCLGTFRLL